MKLSLIYFISIYKQGYAINRNISAKNVRFQNRVFIFSDKFEISRITYHFKFHIFLIQKLAIITITHLVCWTMT